MTSKDSIVRVGLAVFVIKDGTFLFMQRQGAHGEGTWSVPGGHQEFGESFEQTAQREVMEETGLKIEDVRLVGVTNDIMPKENKHYITIWVTSRWANGIEKIMEPNKCSQMMWCTFDTLPSPLFSPFADMIHTEMVQDIKARM